MSKERGEEVARNFGLDYWETSAAEGTNVNEMFFYSAKLILDAKAES